jgi:DNA (cytosine-5)-methyltransferase 1
MNKNPLLGIGEISIKLNISQKVVRKHIAAGTLQSIKLNGSFKVYEDVLLSFANKILSQSSIEEVKKTEKSKKKIISDNKDKSDKIDWVNVFENWNSPSKAPLTFVDLFSGAGGITKGFELAGLKGICGLDWFEAAAKTYRKNFKHSFVEGDIRLPEKKKKFYDTVVKKLKGQQLNIVAGGFPCQGFSMAGNRIIDDSRNSLYKELLEIVETLQPEFVVCENVVGIRSMLEGKVEAMILQDFAKAGYNMNVTVLRAADYAVPQKRDRVIFIGNRIGKINYYPKPFLEPTQYITTGEAIADLMNHKQDAAFNHVPTKHSASMMERMLLLEEGKSLYKGYSDAWKKCPWNEPSCTIKENHGGVNIHPKLARVLTAREMARLQSFPDDFIFEGPKTKQLVQLGNAVPPLLSKAIGLAIRKSYNL